MSEIQYNTETKRGWRIILIDESGTDILHGYAQDKAEKHAKELVRRWNAFEEGGLVKDICIQLMDLYSSCVDTATPEVYGTILGLHEKLESALTKS